MTDAKRDASCLMACSPVNETKLNGASSLTVRCSLRDLRLDAYLSVSKPLVLLKEAEIWHYLDDYRFDVDYLIEETTETFAGELPVKDNRICYGSPERLARLLSSGREFSVHVDSPYFPSKISISLQGADKAISEILVASRNSDSFWEVRQKVLEEDINSKLRD